MKIKKYINIIALLNATTDTYAWQNFILHGMAEIYFISGRLRFFQNGVVSKNPSQHPSALVCWRKNEREKKNRGIEKATSRGG